MGHFVPRVTLTTAKPLRRKAPQHILRFPEGERLNAALEDGLAMAGPGAMVDREAPRWPRVRQSEALADFETSEELPRAREHEPSVLRRGALEENQHLPGRLSHRLALSGRLPSRAK